MKSKKPEFARVFIYNLLIIILVTVGAIVSFWIYQTYDDFGKKVKTLRKDYIEKKKREIRNEVIRITNYIDYRKNIITRDKKINLTCEFKKLYYNIFQYYNDNKTLPKEKLRQNILNIINSDNFNNNKYFTIAYILDKNKLEVNKLIRRNGKYRKVPAHDPSITKLIYSYKHEDLGNDEYLWYLHGGGGFNCINSNKLQYIKLGLVKYFKPLNIYIMLAAYAENLVKKIQDDILGWINRLSFPRNHYFFIDTYEGTSLVFDGKRVGKSSEAPIREKYLKNYRKKAQKIIDTHKRGYLYYPVPTKNGKLLYNKISYIETMDDWDWIVGSGFYMEDIENEIKIMREKLEIKTIYNISHIVLFLLFFIVISLLIAHFLIRKAKKSFSQFNDFFKKSASSSALIDPDKQTYREFKQLADSANSMIKKRKEIEEALIYSRHQFKDIAESMADWIWEIDKHLRYKYVSGKVKKLLGYDPEQCLGEFFSTIYLKDCEKTAKNNFTEKIEKKEVIEDFDIWINTVDGKRVCLQTNAIPFYDEAGNFCGYRGISKDITDRIKAVMELKHHKENLENLVEMRTKELAEKQAQLIHSSRLAALGEMAAGMAHEINQPLSTMKITLNNLNIAIEKKTPDKDYIKKKSEKLNKSIDKISNIITHVRTFSREQSEGHKEKEKFNIKESIENAVQLLGQQIENNKINLKVDVLKDEIYAKGDIYRLEQVIINLLSNAKDAVLEKNAKEPGIKMEINLYVKVKDEKIFIIVKDNGIGIPPDNLAKIMNPFFTTKEAGKGTGLGLSISYGIIQEMSGDIHFKSNSEGTSAVLILPLVK